MSECDVLRGAEPLPFSLCLSGRVEPRQKRAPVIEELKLSLTGFCPAFEILFPVNPVRIGVHLSLR
jgi:hypothetical protein